jgi:CheY-like chemotaxis protein
MDNLDAVVILLVEDDPGHAKLIEKNLRRAGLLNELVVVTDGARALDFVMHRGEFSERENSHPLLILLDLNLPVLDGYQVLQRLKAANETKTIPIVILTTTDDPREVARCYELGCNVYVTKPVEYEQFSEAIRQLGLFLSVVTIANR